MGEKFRPEFGFTSPSTGAEFKSQNPISEQAKGNTLFVEKLKSLESLPKALEIHRTLLDAGPKKVAELEQFLAEQGRGLQDFLKLSSNTIHPSEKDECSQYISEFFTTQSLERKKQLAGFITKILS